MIVDTGVFVAAANETEPEHEACAQLLISAEAPVIVPGLVIAEATFMIERGGGPLAEARFLRSLRSPRFMVEGPTGDDLARMADVVEQYADLPLGGTDASIVALAERLGETTLASLDHRHFSVVRPRHCDAFTLLP